MVDDTHYQYQWPQYLMHYCIVRVTLHICVSVSLHQVFTLVHYHCIEGRTPLCASPVVALWSRPFLMISLYQAPLETPSLLVHYWHAVQYLVSLARLRSFYSYNIPRVVCVYATYFTFSSFFDALYIELDNIAL